MRSADSFRRSGSQMQSSPSLARASSLMETRLAGKITMSHGLWYSYLTSQFRSPNDFKNELRILVDLDAEEGRPNRPPRADGKDNKHHVKINKAKNGKVNLSTIKAYLEGTMDFDTPVLEAISQPLIEHSSVVILTILARFPRSFDSRNTF